MILIRFQIYTLNIDDADDCASKFRANKNLGVLFFLAIVASAYLKAPTEDNSGGQGGEELPDDRDRPSKVLEC